MQSHEVEKKHFADVLGALLGLLMIPMLLVGAAIVVPVVFAFRWIGKHREHSFRMLMKSRGRLMSWPELLRELRDTGGTCIEERFSSKGPVRFWWTRDDVYRDSPYEIIDWFTMRKGRGAEPFIHWCRARYTNADAGSALLVDTGLVPRREIYALWSKCRSQSMAARWVEVAPPEILPPQVGQ